jgi:glycosyltransferase involved in cell wall biosynthesis
MFSAVILTLNEEKALPDCLASLRGCDDIVVLDSGSTDKTAALALAAGARVVERPFDSFAGQRNYADRAITYKNPWVFHLDADERMTPALFAECLRATQRDDLDGFRVAPRMMYEGRWVRHCTDFPAYQARLVHSSSFAFIQVGHGQREAPGMRLENLKENYLHDMSIYGKESWIAKHRRYAADEARNLLGPSELTGARQLFSREAIMRRRALKKLSYKLPFRPLVRFAYQYGLRGGFLDGIEGLKYCILLSRYEGFIAEEIKRLRGIVASA